MKEVISNIAVALMLGLPALAVHAANNSSTEKVSPARMARSPLVTEAWARATVPGQPVGAVYMKIDSPFHATLIHVETDVAKQVQVHDMHMHNGVMRMRQHGPLDIPAAKTVEFAPGRMHLMLLGLQKPLNAGDTVSLTMTFVDAKKSKITSIIKVPVRPIGQ